MLQMLRLKETRRRSSWDFVDATLANALCPCVSISLAGCARVCWYVWRTWLVTPSSCQKHSSSLQIRVPKLNNGILSLLLAKDMLVAKLSWSSELVHFLGLAFRRFCGLQRTLHFYSLGKRCAGPGAARAVAWHACSSWGLDWSFCGWICGNCEQWRLMVLTMHTYVWVHVGSVLLPVTVDNYCYFWTRPLVTIVIHCYR